MKVYQEREKITLAFSIRGRKKYVEVKFGGDDIRFLEKLKQMRYSDHTIRVYTTYFGDFQIYFAGRSLKLISAEDINAYLLSLIDKKQISSCQQNQRINAIKFYYEKVLGQERRCYKGKKGESTAGRAE